MPDTTAEPIQAECDHCGNNTFVVYRRDGQIYDVECDICGAVLDA